MSEEKKPQKLSLRRRSEKVVVEKPDGQEVVWTVREMDGSSRDIYLNGQRGKVVVGKDKSVEVKDYTGLFASLLAMTVYDENDTIVDPREIQKWPASMQQALFDIANKLNGLDKDAKEEAKNDSTASASPG